MASDNPDYRFVNEVTSLKKEETVSSILKKVLIIDDSAEIRAIMAESLSLYGFTTLTAENGTSGIQMAKDHLPDLIICDINMPDMDGYATLTALREDEATAGIPFIFLSGASDKINMRRGMELGADDYLTKPFTHQELLAAVKTRLEKQAEIKRRSEKKLEELRDNITLALPHELRTPLNGILGLASLLIEDYDKLQPEEVLESARYIHESALRLHRLIENFLVYSQIELMAAEPGRVMDMGNVEPASVSTTVPEVARSVAEKHQRSDDLQLDVEEGHVRVPAEKLRKIIEELVDNACKFSEAGKPVQLRGQLKGNAYVISVVDQGRGMTPEQISKIGPHMQFERDTYEQQGSGLGLIIAKRLTELMGGQLNIRSVYGEGTTVELLFTVAPQSQG